MGRRIESVLVANRGEIAARIIAAARTMDVATVAVFSDADEGLPFVDLADRAVRLPGVTPAETYLQGDRLIEIALAHGADAIHPGYGFLSEHPGFAAACIDAGLAFVGPPPAAIARMGSKVQAKELMAAAGVPVLPGMTLPESQSADALLTAAESIGFPVIVKASAGGGGRGMRIVHESGELVDAVASAAREAASAFGDGTVFLERFVEAPRHVEVQVVADEHGTVATLFERDCSIQRRHQKLVEEAPAPGLDDELRTELCRAAAAAARAVEYVNAGTVEFVLGPDGTFGFLEMNTRLQVEHPVTEIVTGIDLVALQIAVARGEPLPEAVLDASVHGHAIEARLYAEDVAAGFLPVSGHIDRLRFPDEPWLRVDAGYADGSDVSPYYDAMLAKVIAFGATREEAAERLAAALGASEIHGLTTNRDLLVGILRHAEFLSGPSDTSFLERVDVLDLARRPLAAAASHVHLVAAALSDREARRATSPLPAGIPLGWRNVGPSGQRLLLAEGDHTASVELALRRDSRHAVVDGVRHDLGVVDATTARVRVELDGTLCSCRVHRVDDRIYVDSALGSSAYAVVDPFPSTGAGASSGSLVSPMPGVVVAVAAAVGDRVEAGTPLVTLEAMKMEHSIQAPYAGVVVEVCTAVGAQVDRGSVLVVLQPEVADDA
ncbi:MAG TPA: biotin carboxylase N-terminal domain-containing protein [Acidimicrobiia bacterium]|jgi:acetyl/propionyl-CoA carboxylase alpha subunit